MAASRHRFDLRLYLVEALERAVEDTRHTRDRARLATDLRRIWVRYLDFEGVAHDGNLIVHRDVAAPVQRAGGSALLAG